MSKEIVQFRLCWRQPGDEVFVDDTELCATFAGEPIDDLDDYVQTKVAIKTIDYDPTYIVIKPFVAVTVVRYGASKLFVGMEDEVENTSLHDVFADNLQNIIKLCNKTGHRL